ncbi:hypothetical protein [Quadrisphaera sp. INWT6]|uniref:hypothetical protein n=1 Tax=Quadrisphaera sp. INWT6 TaxID=2596917 RepID=UPI0018920916|nr:hypothetical protein [Quadrisphaera sp. INWT6]
MALVIQALLHAAVPRGVRPGVPASAAVGAGAPALLLGWTWLGSALAGVAFFGRPWAGLWVFVVMGVVAAPALLRVLRPPRP